MKGVAAGDTVEFLGVRYAEAPVGENRWTLPEPVADTDDIIDASTPGPSCPQAPAATDSATSLASDVEDCLFLNVTVPTRPSDGPRPVMVWWHGGGFTSGSGALYDARRLVDRGDVIVVTANYRLGMLGYLALPGLEGSGNFGLADQFEALRWANENASAFGGDPDNVTLFGESAGAISTCAALTSSAAQGLVDRAIMSSGSCRLAWPTGTLFPGVPATAAMIPLADAEAVSAAAVEAVGCVGADVLACLRRQPLDVLVAQGDSFGTALAYGTDLLPKDPAAVIEAGDSLPVPVIVAHNRDEHRSFVGGLLLGAPDAITAATYPTLLEASFGSNAALVDQQYPLTDFASAAEAWSTLVTDVAWACTTSHVARDFAAAGSPTWMYEFADRSAPDVSNVGASGLSQGAAHATDLPYVFDLGGEDLLAGAGQRALGDTMIDLWTSFAHTASPTADRVTDWPAVSASDAPVLRLDADNALVDHRTEHRCAFWESIVPV